MDESEGFSDTKPYIICTAVLFLFLIGVTAFAIIRDNMWREKKTKLAEKKCKEYTKYACDNPFNKTLSNMSSPIIQGDDAPVGMFPHQAYVEFRKRGMKLRNCGGSLISEYFVLSAAHCIHGLKNYEGRVKLGSVMRNSDGTGQWFRILNAYPYHSYNHGTGENDVVLLKLSKKVEFKAHLRPICLNTKFQKEYHQAIASGWGRTENELEPLHLKMVRLFVDHLAFKSKCQSLCGVHYDLNYICAGDLFTSKSSHQGDSGGPLQVPLNKGCPNTYELIGVTASVEKHKIKLNQTLLSFYTRVDYFIPWIASHVWANEPD